MSSVASFSGGTTSEIGGSHRPAFAGSHVLVTTGSLVMDSSGSISYGFLSQCGDGSTIHGGELSDSSYGLSSHAEDAYARLDSAAGYKRSPVRGLLRAVSSLTITDVELFEECITQLRCNVSQSMSKKTNKTSPTAITSTDSSPSFPVRSSSRKTSLKPKRGGTNGRRMRSKSQGEESDDEKFDFIPFHAPLVDTTDLVGTMKNNDEGAIDHLPSKELASTQLHPRQKSNHSCPEIEQEGAQKHERRKSQDLVCAPDNNGTRYLRQSSSELGRCSEQEGIPQRPRRSKTEPNSEKKESGFQRRPRRKSFDLLPSVPRRISSVEGSSSCLKSKKVSVTTMNNRTDDLNLQGTVRLQNSKPSNLMKMETNRASPDRNQLSSEHDEISKTIPSSNGLQLFDRFNSDSGLPRLDLDSLTPSGAPTRNFTVLRNEQDIGCLSDRSGDDADLSPYRVREFVVSLEDLEDIRVQSDKLCRRASFDSLPTPPKRSMDEFGGSDSDIDDERRTTEGRRRSFDDVWQTSQQFLNEFPGYVQNLNDSEAPGRFHTNLDQSSRSTESQEIKKSSRSTPTSGNSRRSRRRGSAEKALNRDPLSGRSNKGHDEVYGLNERLPFLDFSTRSNAASPVAENAFQRNRSSSSRSRRPSGGSRNSADHLLVRTTLDDHDGSESSESRHSNEPIYGRSPTASMLFNLDFSTRSQSIDCVPALPRRRLPSENSFSNLSCEGTIQLDDLQPTKDGEISDSTLDLPATSRKEYELAASIASKLSSASKVSSITMSDFHDDTSSLSSRIGRAHSFLDLSSTMTKRTPHGHLMSDKDQYMNFGDETKRARDKLPPLPIREHSNPTLSANNSLDDEDGYTSSDEGDIGEIDSS